MVSAWKLAELKSWVGDMGVLTVEGESGEDMIGVCVELKSELYCDCVALQ